jgi:predicted metal-dependent enzyme (double-stranded beta helix superfamily)
VLATSCPDAFLPLQRLGGLSQELTRAYLSGARAVLEQFVARPDLFDGLDLQSNPSGYARNLLYGDGQMSVWAMTWAPGAQTSIHDHHCSCCFGVVRGRLSELWFRALDERRAVVTHVATREPGYVASMLPSGPNIHQMINEGAEEAVSIHIYGFDHRLCGSSIRREYEVTST